VIVVYISVVSFIVKRNKSAQKKQTLTFCQSLTIVESSTYRHGRELN